MGTIDLVRPLGIAGIRCAVVAPSNARVRYSRFAVDVIEKADPSREPDVLVERLLAFGQMQPERPVLYYEGDSDLLLVSRRRDRLATVFRLVVPAAELVEQLVDKERFAALAEQARLPVPPSQRLPAGAGVETVHLDFPLILKPVTRGAARGDQEVTWRMVGAGAKALRVNDARGLRSVLGTLGENGVDVMVQALIEGPERKVESYHAYVDDAGAIAGEFTGRKIRTYPVTNGFSTALEITASHDITEMGRGILELIGLRGVVKLDFKRDAAGRLHLLEINPRFNLWHHPGAVAGVNIPALVYADAVGLPRPTVRPVRAGVRWCHVERDWRARRAAGIGLASWLAWVLGCEAKRGIALDDPGPWLRGTIVNARAAAMRVVTRRAARLRHAARPLEL